MCLVQNRLSLKETVYYWFSSDQLGISPSEGRKIESNKNEKSEGNEA